MKALVQIVALTALLAGLVAPALVAQGEEPMDQPMDEPAEESAATTLSGCLTGTDGQWMISGDEGVHAVVEGAADLEPHNGHQVRLTGEWQEDAEGQNAFVAGGIEHLGVCPE
jgi:hypothetical protein